MENKNNKNHFIWLRLYSIFQNSVHECSKNELVSLVCEVLQEKYGVTIDGYCKEGIT